MEESYKFRSARLALYHCTSMLPGVLALLVAVAVDLALLPRSRLHTWRSLLVTYCARRAIQVIGWYKWRQVRARYSDLYGAQERFVLETVKRHADSDYGRQHRFSEMHSLEVCICVGVDNDRHGSE